MSNEYYLWPWNITKFEGDKVQEIPIEGAYGLYEVRDGSLYGPVDNNVYSTGELDD